MDWKHQQPQSRVFSLLDVTVRVVWQFVHRFCEDWWKIVRLKPCLSVEKSRVSTFSNVLSLLSVSLSHPTAPRWSDVRLQFVSIFVWIAWWDFREDAETDLSRASWVERSEVSTKKHQTIFGSLFLAKFQRFGLPLVLFTRNTWAPVPPFIDAGQSLTALLLRQSSTHGSAFFNTFVCACFFLHTHGWLNLLVHYCNATKTTKLSNCFESRTQ